MDNAGKAKYLTRTVNMPQPIHQAQEQYYLGKVTIRSVTSEELKGVPKEYKLSPSGHGVGFQFNKSSTALGPRLTQDRKQILKCRFERQ
jgi:hypothetical protein